MNIVSHSPAKRGRSRLAVIAASTVMVVAILALPATSAELGDIRRGQAHAEKVCAECHAIGPNETASPRADATPFGVMSRVAGINERALTVFLQTPHSDMPNLIIVGQERDDLIAYILSLRGRP